ncbi:MAG TPA: carboxypeptidase-like regulatory domain-containing protein, partial [Chitinophagaceae bacterium]
MKTVIVRSYLILVLLAIYQLAPVQGIAAGRATDPTTGTLSGKVTDKKGGGPLAGATVYIADLKIGAVADNNGNYSFKTLPSGTYLIEARYVGYKAVTRNVSISGAVTENFELADNAVEESVVVVTGLSKAT